MTIAEKIARAKTDLDEVYEAGRKSVEALDYEAGKKAQYDEFWDVFQDYGNRTSYNYAFSYGWTNENFKPKYDIRPTGDYGADQIFVYNNKTLDIEAGLAYNGVVLDFSEATRLNGCFDRCNVVNIPPIDARSCKTMIMTFYSVNSLKKLTINNIREDCTFDRAFSYCSGLEELNVSGTIGQNGLNLQWNRKLSKASITSVINVLSSSTSGLTVTVSLTAVNKAFETSEGANDGSTSTEWTLLIGTKSNWTISLV